MKLYISDLKTDQQVTLMAACARKDLRMTKTGKPYLVLALKDKSGEIEARVWDNSEYWSGQFSAGEVIKVAAVTNEYRDVLQLSVNKLRRCADDEYSLADFLPYSEREPEALYQAVFGIALSVTNEPIRELLAITLTEHRDLLLRSAAAIRMHHAYVGGLLEHMLSMAEAGHNLCEHYTRLNRDLVIAGCILHDIGKCREMRTGLAFETTSEGQFIGHIGIGLMLVEKYAEIVKMPETLKHQLQHLVLSHHGEYQWGSPKLPSTPEAIALHYIDNLDAKLNQAFAFIDATPAGDKWSAWIPGMQRAMYCGERAAVVEAEQEVVNAG